MSSRRAFLTSVGTGLVGLGLPAAARAWGRRRRCAPPPCPAVAAPCEQPLSERPFGPTCLCPQSVVDIGGVNYYNCEVCPAGTSYELVIDTQPYGLVSGCAACNSGKCFAPPPGWRPKTTLHMFPAVVRDTSGIKQALPTDKLPTMPAGVFLLCHHDVQITVGGTALAVRLMVLGFDIPAGGPSPFVLAPIGQQSDLSVNGLQDLGSQTAADHYVPVAFDDITYHVLLAKSVRKK